MSNRIDDGFSTTIALLNLPSVKLYEKDVTPPGVTAGGPVDTTTMRNTTWRTVSPRHLKTLTPVTCTVAFAFEAIEDIQEQIGVNQSITITFPDGSTLTFYGWIEEFTPGAFTEGEQPTASLTIQPSNRATDDALVAPEYNDISVTLTTVISALDDFLFVAEEGTVRITITNSSDGPASDVVVTITLPESFTFISSESGIVQEANILTYTIAEIGAGQSEQIDVIVSPTTAGMFGVEATVVSGTVTTGQSVLYDQLDYVVFDRGPCAVTTLDAVGIVSAGGDKFDCYAVGDILSNVNQGSPNMELIGGTGFTSFWSVGDSPFIAIGDNFESYSDQDPVAEELSGGSGFASAWRFS